MDLWNHSAVEELIVPIISFSGPTVVLASMDKAKTEPTKREGALCCISTRTGGQLHSGGAGLLLSTASSSGRTSINYKQLFKYLALIQESPL